MDGFVLLLAGLLCSWPGLATEPGHATETRDRLRTPWTDRLILDLMPWHEKLWSFTQTRVGKWRDLLACEGEEIVGTWSIESVSTLSPKDVGTALLSAEYAVGKHVIICDDAILVERAKEPSVKGRNYRRSTLQHAYRWFEDYEHAAYPKMLYLELEQMEMGQSAGGTATLWIGQPNAWDPHVNRQEVNYLPLPSTDDYFFLSKAHWTRLTIRKVPAVANMTNR